MPESKSFSAKQSSPEYFYDINSRQLLLGQVAVDYHIETGGHPADLYDLNNPSDLGQLFFDADHVLPRAFEKPDYKAWRAQQYIKYGRQLLELLPPQENRNEINRNVINRASQLGRGPTTLAIVNSGYFETLSDFYRKIGAHNTHKIDSRKVIDSTTVRRQLIEYIISVGDEIGRRPTERELLKRHAEDPSLPSSHVIANRFGSLANATELAGYCAPYSWEKEDFLNWGVRFMLANEGWLPTSRHLDLLSKKGLGPPCATTIEYFNGSMALYQAELEQTYLEHMQHTKDEHQRKLALIKEGLESGTLPLELFEGAESDEDRIERYARYIVAAKFIDSNKNGSLLSISTMSNPTVISAGFKRSIKKVAHVSDGEIESTALYLHLYDDIFPPDLSYLERLRVQQLPRSYSARKIQYTEASEV